MALAPALDSGLQDIRQCRTLGAMDPPNGMMIVSEQVSAVPVHVNPCQAQHKAAQLHRVQLRLVHVHAGHAYV